MKLVISISLIFISLLAQEVGDTIYTKDKVNARSSHKYSSSSGNILFTLNPGVEGKVVQVKKFSSGGKGLRVKLTSGSRKGETVYLYYHRDKNRRTVRVEKTKSLPKLFVLKQTLTIWDSEQEKWRPFPKERELKLDVSYVADEYVRATDGDGRYYYIPKELYSLDYIQESIQMKSREYCLVDPTPIRGTELTISNTGRSFIRGGEGFESKMYNCPGGHCTIGFGHLVHYGCIDSSSSCESPFRNADGTLRTISREEAENLFTDDLNERVLSPMKRFIDEDILNQLSQNQVDSLGSFIYNVGEGNFRRSTLLKKLNEGDLERVANEMLRFNKSGGRYVQGLANRREKERQLFLSE